MERFNIETLTNGNYDYCDDADNLNAFKDLVVEKLGYRRADIQWSKVLSKWHDDDSWNECRTGPGKYRQIVDSGEIPDLIIHGIISGKTWELTDNSLLVSKSITNRALCIYVKEEGDETIYTDVHDIGGCPFMEYYSQVMKKYILKVSTLAYIEFEGADRDKEAEKCMIARLKDNIVAALDSTQYDLQSDLEYELDHDDFVVTVGSADVAVTRIKRLPRGRYI